VHTTPSRSMLVDATGIICGLEAVAALVPGVRNRARR
jgi:hypothetical protein